MTQKTNKIIILIGIILIFALFYWAIKVYKPKETFLPSVEVEISPEQEKMEVLKTECELPEEFLMNICRYSPLNKAMPITTQKEIEKNNEKTTIAVVNFGDLDIFKINLNQLITNESYKDISSKLPENFQLCFRIQPLLEKIQIIPQQVFSLNSNDIFCTKLLSKYSLPQISFLGYIPYPQKENEEISISTYLVPQEIKLTDSNSLNENFFKLTHLVAFIPAIIEK